VGAFIDRVAERAGPAKTLLDDLVDFNRTKLGLGIKIALADVDLAAVFADELDQLRGAISRNRPLASSRPSTSGLSTKWCLI
jgi:hypothetical protein